MFQAIEKKHSLPAGLRRILYIFCVLAILGDTIYSYVHSSVFLLEKSFKRAKIGLPYHIWTVSVIIFLFLYDTPRSYRNDMEIAAMEEIAMSEKDTVPLTCERTRIVSWEAPSVPEESETAGRLLYLWKVTDKEKLFYFPQE